MVSRVQDKEKLGEKEWNFPNIPDTITLTLDQLLLWTTPQRVWVLQWGIILWGWLWCCSRWISRWTESSGGCKHCFLVVPCLFGLQGTVTANEFRQYRLEVSLALTKEEGNQMLGELVGADRIVGWCKSSHGRAGQTNNTCFLLSLMVWIH